MKKAIIILQVPHGTDIDDALEAVIGAGKTLRCGVQADIRWMPISQGRHTNQGVVKFPHRHGQYRQTTLPEPPDFE